MKHRIDSAWFHDAVTDEDREEVRDFIRKNKIVLDKLKKILYNIRDNRASTRRSDYDNPSWSHLQAHQNGNIEALDLIISILTTDPREERT